MTTLLLAGAIGYYLPNVVLAQLVGCASARSSRTCPMPST